MRTWAPRGVIPDLRTPLTRDHLSVSSGITPAGQLLLQMRDRSLRGPDVVCFLQHLLRHIPGKLLVIWDGAPIHRAQVVKDFLAQGGVARIWLEQLPAYAPELNPDEGWNYLMGIELRNLCCDDLSGSGWNCAWPRSASATSGLSSADVSPSAATPCSTKIGVNCAVS